MCSQGSSDRWIIEQCFLLVSGKRGYLSLVLYKIINTSMIRRRRSIRGVLIRAIVIIISASIIIIPRLAPRTEIVAAVRMVSVIGIVIRSVSISVPILVVIPVPVIVIVTARVGSLSLVLFSTITITNKMSSVFTIITNRRLFHSGVWARLSA